MWCLTKKLLSGVSAFLDAREPETNSWRQDVAEDNVEAVPLPENYIEQFFEKHASMAKYFQSVQVEETSGNLKRWRLVLSPESKANYPEDDAIASAWVQEGVLP